MNQEEIKKVDDHLENSTASVSEVKTADQFASMPQAQMLNVLGLVAIICNAYATAKPVIDFIVKYLLFWKPKWKNAINNVETAIEDACAALNPTPPASNQ